MTDKNKSWWEKKWKNAKCGITLGRLRPGKNSAGKSYVVKTNCGHRFFRTALAEWCLKCQDDILPMSCPLCRTPIRLETFTDT